ncbi:MAG: ferritin [Thermoguttaceae bacterium]
MLSPDMSRLLNEQVNAEIYSSYLYMAMAAWAQEQNLAGMSHWLMIQAEEERIHALKFFQFVLERGASVAFTQIAAPPSTWNSPREVFEQVRSHEAYVTKLVNALVDQAIKDSDHATNNFLQWFVAEQVEEEASAEQVLRQFRLMSDTPGFLYMLDKELATRVLNPLLAALRPS